MHMRKTDGNKQITPHYRKKKNNPEQSLIEIYTYYQHLSYSLKLAVMKCNIEYYIKQPDIC